MQTLRLAIVGVGNGAQLLVNALPGVPGIKLVALCDPNYSKLQRKADEWKIQCTYSSGERLLAEVPRYADLIHVATPSGLHKVPVIAALRAGKSVLCEKPLAASHAEQLQILGVAAESPGQLFVVSQNRWWRAFQLTESTLRSGRLGKHDLTLVTSLWNRGDEYYMSSGWRGTWDIDGGAALINQGIHGFDNATWLTAIARQTTRADLFECIGGLITRLGHAPHVLQAEDYAYVHAELSNGGLFQMEASTCATPEQPVTIHLVGSLGEVKINSLGQILKWNFARGGPEDEEAASLFADETVQSGDVGAASNPLLAKTAPHVGMLNALHEAITTDSLAGGMVHDTTGIAGICGSEGNFAGYAIRRFYAEATDPQRLKPVGFVA